MQTVIKTNTVIWWCGVRSSHHIWAWCPTYNMTLWINVAQRPLMWHTYLCLRRGRKTPATRWKPKCSACFWAVRREKKTVQATLQGFVTLPGVAAVLLIVATWQDAVAAAASLGCDWRPAGKAPGVPDKWGIGLRVAAPLGAVYRLRLWWKLQTVLLVGGTL